MHTAPDDLGTMATSEGFARSTGWTAAVEGMISHSDYITFPAAGGPGSTLTHFSTGKTSAGAQPALMVGHARWG